jgi:hypothetical protein
VREKNCRGAASGICVGQRVKREREGCASLPCAVGLQPPVSASAKGVKRGGGVFVGEEGEAEAGDFLVFC